MAGYIYLPVVNKEMKGLAEDWQKGQSGKGKTPYEVLKKGSSKLKQILPQDKLYILLHGGGLASREIGADDTTFTPSGIAQHLQKAGYPKSARDLRIFACGSGGRAVVTKDGKESYVPPFVQLLRTEMDRMGYNYIAVYGYTQSVYATYGDITSKETGIKGSHKSVMTSHDGLVRASEGRVVFYGSLRTEADSDLPNMAYINR